MPPLFGSNTQEKNVQDLKKQVDELQKQIHLQSQLQVQSTKVLQNALNNQPEEKEELLYKWSAPERATQKRDRQWYWTAALVVLIITVVLLVFGEPILVGAVFSILFVLYVTSLVPPVVVEHKLTSLGIRTADQLFRWEELTDFWFSFRNSKEILNLDTKLNSPRRLIFFFTRRDKGKILEILKDKIQYKSAPEKQGWVSRNADGLYIPLTDIESAVDLDRQYEKANA